MKNSIFKLIIILGIFFSSSCCKDETRESDSVWSNNILDLYIHNETKTTIAQGVKGTLTLIEGDCMPIVDPNGSCKEYPVSRTIKIHEKTNDNQLTKITPTTFSNINTKLVATIKTDKEGFYQTNLPSGKYSVFIEEKGALYANEWDSDGDINSFTIENSKTTIKNNKINYAVY
jgi:hypothetical protein